MPASQRAGRAMYTTAPRRPSGERPKTSAALRHPDPGRKLFCSFRFVDDTFLAFGDVPANPRSHAKLGRADD